MLCAVLSKSRKRHPTKQQLYGPLSPISQTIQVRWTSLQKLRQTHKQHSPVDSYTWTHQYWLTSKNIHQLNLDTVCQLEDQEEWPIGTDDKRESRELVQSAWLDDNEEWPFKIFKGQIFFFSFFSKILFNLFSSTHFHHFL